MYKLTEGLIEDWRIQDLENERGAISKSRS
jgi:hypothetical protein